jgi:hypothetical protein
MATAAAEVLAHEDGPFPAPHTYRLSPGESFQPSSICVLWDGSGAGGDFLPCCSFYSKDGKLLGRAFPGTIPAGDSVRVTYSPFALSPPAAAGIHFSPPDNVSPPGTPDFTMTLLGLLNLIAGTSAVLSSNASDGSIAVGLNAYKGIAPGIGILTGDDGLEVSTGDGDLDILAGIGKITISGGRNIEISPGGVPNGELILDATSQSTVGPAGAADPPPASPERWLHIAQFGGAEFVVPLYKRA